jgi:uncharacterized protein (TIGR00661 family)
VSKKILYCVLDWGLGHASRSVPIIQGFLDKEQEVVLASNGNALLLLQMEFPNLKSIELPDYDIQYKHESIALNLLSQSFKVLRSIKKENRQVDEIVKNLKIDLIVSDCRFGCYHPECDSIMITHQLRLLHPKRFIQASATRLNKKLIHQFNQVWVPDYETVPNLSGEMSHHTDLNIPIKFIGPQSRFKVIPVPDDPRYKVLAILSGPEPQRTYLEHKIKEELIKIPGSHIIVRGIASEENQDANIHYLGLQDVHQLTSLVSKSKYIISRSGYSSLMDYNAMKRKAILIPTPGQTEQEYLAEVQFKTGHHIVLSQEHIDLSKLIK